MKTIHLIHYQKPEGDSIFIERNRYVVSFGNGTRKVFRSESKCKRYLAETNRALTFKLHEYNLIYCDIYRMYRIAWFYFDKDHQAETAILQALSSADKLFSLIVERSHYENGNSFVFSHFKAIEGYLKQALGELKETYHRLNHHSLVYDLECILQRILYVSQSIDNYVLPGKVEKIEKQQNTEPLLRAVK